MLSIRPNYARPCIASLVATLACVLLFANVTYGQATAGAIKGLISDSSGAAIPDAQVQATNLATNERFSTVTTATGNYALVNVPLGNYQVEAQKTGFKRMVRQPVKVLTATSTGLDLTLEVGEISEQISVEASVTPLIQVDNAEVSTSMELAMLTDLPLKVGGASQSSGSGRRQIDTFTFLTPGVTGTGWAKNILGSPTQTLQNVIDGVTFSLQGSPGLIERTSPPFQAVEEFKISTSMYSADQGRGFGISNYSIKSGANDFHGEAAWLLRNDKTDARGFFNAQRPIIRQNEIAVAMGGPVIKDKTFFFGAYTLYKRRGGATQRGLFTGPSLAFRRGDFSELRNPTTGVQIPIFDPNTTRPDGSGGFVRDPFPGNIIPSGRISPIATKLMDLVPPPDLPGIVNNFISRAANPVNDDSYGWKVDHSFNPKHRLSVSGWWAFLRNRGQAVWGDAPVDYNSGSNFDGGGVRANWDWVISPTLLNHFGAGYNGYTQALTGNSAGESFQGNQLLGIPGIPLDAPGLPTFAPTGYTQMGNSSGFPENLDESSLILTDTMSFLRGKHQFKFGGEFWQTRFTRHDRRSSAGLLNFSNSSTSQPNSPSFGVWGDSMASLLLGEVFSSTLRRNSIPNGYDTRYWAMFIEDKFQVTPRLTLSLGLRYDLPWPIKSYQDVFAVVDLTAPNPAAGGRPGAYAFGNDARPFGLSKGELAPRLALGYRVNDKTVIRSGFGVIYAQSNAQVNSHEIFGNNYLTGYSVTSQPVSLDQGVTPAFRLDSGFPAYTGPQLPNLNPGLSVGGVADHINPDSGRSAYTSNWTFSVQRELPWSLFLDMAYVGVKGSRLPSNLEEINQVPSRYLSLGSLLQASITSPQAVAAGFTPPYPGFTGSVAQSLRPFPQYTNFVTHISPIGNHSYHALQTKVQRRFSGGLGMLVSYTLSKIISDTNGTGWSGTESRSLDTENRGLEKAISPVDRTHNLITNWIYELPVGRGATGITGKLLGGWGTGLTTTYTSGAPLRIAGGPPLPIFNGVPNRPNRVAGVSRRTTVSPGAFDPAKDLYLNISAFSQPAPFTFGDVGRVEPDLRGFTLWNEDVAVFKRTYISSISEQFNVEFRAEFFNIFNRVVFTDPAVNVNTPASFGRVSGQRNEPRNIQFMIRISF